MDEQTRRKVWVTGGAGFIGSHLVETLAARGDDITVIDDLSTGFSSNLEKAAGSIRFVESLLEAGHIQALLAEDVPEVIFHLAGDALVARSVADPQTDCNRNLLPTLSLLDAVRCHSRTSKVVFASTGAVYGDRAAMPFEERDAVCPISPYAVSKLASERYCYAFAHTYGLRTCSLRLFSVYGPRQNKQVIYDLIRKISANPAEVPLFGDGRQERDFSHVLNIIDAFVLAADKAEFHGEVFNVAGDEIVTIRALAEMIAREMGATPRFVFSGEQRPGDAQRWVADTSRLRSLGYRPRISLAAGLEDTVAWFRQRRT